jgi:hypothetical protein
MGLQETAVSRLIRRGIKTYFRKIIITQNHKLGFCVVIQPGEKQRFILKKKVHDTCTEGNRNKTKTILSSRYSEIVIQGRITNWFFQPFRRRFTDPVSDRSEEWMKRKKKVRPS